MKKKKLPAFKTVIELARKAGACEDDLRVVEKLGSWAKALKHNNAPYWLYWYACNVIKDRWPEAEPVIAKNCVVACGYAYHVIRGRWPEVEETITKDPEAIYLYARDIIKGRWPEAEALIAKYPEWALYYSFDVIKGRWPEAEEMIAKDPYWNSLYNIYLREYRGK